jgi:hypothetical protein
MSFNDSKSVICSCSENLPFGETSNQNFSYQYGGLYQVKNSLAPPSTKLAIYFSISLAFFPFVKNPSQTIFLNMFSFIKIKEKLLKIYQQICFIIQDI